MTRKFKMAGVLVAVVAMFALTASSASAIFTSANYPATGSGESTADVFDAFGSTVECTHNTFTVEKQGGGNIAGPENSVTVTATYTDCEAAFLPATVNMTGCDYVFHSNAPTPTALTVDLVCPAGVTGVDITAYSSSTHGSAICHDVVHPFTNKHGLTASTSGNHVLVKGTVEGITATQERTNFLCPAGTHTAAAKYTIQPAGITIKGNNGALDVS